MGAQDNTVELLGHYGGDELHALSAWTSTRRELTEERRDRLPKMLAELAANGHHTPFEKSALHFLVRCDKATHIHIIKHRIAVAVNAESARYRELREDDWLYPSDWPTEQDESLPGTGGALARRIRQLYHHVMSTTHDAYHELVDLVTDWQTERALAQYRGPNPPVESMAALEAATSKLARKRAKESARYVLPHAAMITQDIMFNFRSFMLFMNLRGDVHAQLEVRRVAARMLLNVPHEPFRHSLAAFGWGEARRNQLYREAGLP